MLKKLGSLIRTGTAWESPSSPSEHFGPARISRGLGEEVLRATTTRRNHIQGIRDHLTSMTREEKAELVDRVLARLALFVFDLPASERNHHSERFGLLEHLLEVAHLTARELGSPAFQVSPEPSINHRERPLWVYAGVVAAIAHDIGKTMDLDVAAPGKGAKWDPRAEPLRLFCERHDLKETGPGIWHYRSGRGTDSHERSISNLLPVLLPPEVERYLGPRLASVVHALTVDQHFSSATGIAQAAKEVIKAVRRADAESSRSGLHPREAKRGDTPLAADPNPGILPPQSPPAALPGRPGEAHPSAPSAAAQKAARAIVKPSSEPLAVREETFVAVPGDLWAETVPDPRERKGDPVEMELRMRAELDPPRFLDTIRRMIVMRRFSRNNLYTDVYIRPDYVWLVLPKALRRFARINHLPFDTEVLKRMLESLEGSPHVEPAEPHRVPVYMKPRVDSNTFEAVRIKTQGFLSAADQARLGFHTCDIQSMDLTAFAETASL